MKTPVLLHRLTVTILASFAAWTLAHAAPIAFDFDDPKNVNNVVFQLDAPLESINGTASGITGTVTVDPENPEQVTGRIVVAADSITVPNPVMRGHLVGEKWLNVKAHPEITFEVASVSDIKKTDNAGTAKVTGTLSLHGVSKEITVEAKVTYLPGKLAERSGGRMEGDLLVVRTKFSINRSDYNIQPGENTDKVSEDIDISLAIAGAAQKK